YRGTRLEDELHKVLDRGGVIGGTSAGAAVMSKLMIGGGTVIARVEPGFGFLPGGIIDPHFLKRNRAHRLLQALPKNPGWLALGRRIQRASRRCGTSRRERSSSAAGVECHRTCGSDFWSWLAEKERASSTSRRRWTTR